MLAESEPATPEAHPRKPGRLDYIEGMRGIAALYVALGHIFTMIDPKELLHSGLSGPIWLSWLSRPMWYGHLAVAAFIVISGFCLQLSLFNKGDGRLLDIKRFAKRRCWRILPPYYACLAFSILIALTVTTRQFNLIHSDPVKLAANTGALPYGQYLPVTTQNVLAHVFMIQNVDPAWMYKINGVLWSISIEFQLYFLFPLFVAIMFRKGRAALLAPTVALAAVFMVVYPPATKLYVWYMPLFALGMAAANLAFGPNKESFVSRHSRNPGAVFGVAISFFVLTCIACALTKTLWISDCLLAIAVVSLLVLGTIQIGHPLVRFFSLKRVVWLGAFSYSLYLMHHPILQTVQAFRPGMIDSLPRQFAYLLLIGMPIVLMICFGFYWVFERPFVSGKSKPKPNDEPVPGF